MHTRLYLRIHNLKKKKIKLQLTRYKTPYLFFNIIAAIFDAFLSTGDELLHSANAEFCRPTFGERLHTCLDFIVWHEMNTFQGPFLFGKEMVKNIGRSQIWTTTFDLTTLTCQWKRFRINALKQIALGRLSWPVDFRLKAGVEQFEILNLQKRQVLCVRYAAECCHAAMISSSSSKSGI